MHGDPDIAPDGAVASISVVVGTYNGERYLAEQLDSIFAQTLRPAEVLVSDDGSSDSTLEIAARYSGRGIPLRIHRNAFTLGFGDNFLAAVERASGEFIAFCDQDDVWYPHKLAVQAAVIAKTGASASTHDTDYIDEDGAAIPSAASRTGRRLRVLRESEMEPWGNFLGNTLLVRRQLFLSIPRSERGEGPVDGERLISHDRWAFALAAMADGIALIPQRLSAYRQHSQQLFGVAVARPVRQQKQTQEGVIDREQRLVRLARFRLALLDGDTPASDLARSRRRWRSVVAQHERALMLYEVTSQSAPSRVTPFLARVLHGDYRPARAGGLGTGRLVYDLKVVRQGVQ